MEGGKLVDVRGLCTWSEKVESPLVSTRSSLSSYMLQPESDPHSLSSQTKRATKFLYDVFEYIEERVVVVVTHSGFTRSVLLAVGREPYRPQNTELVPLIVLPARDGVVMEEEGWEVEV